MFCLNKSQVLNEQFPNLKEYLKHGVRASIKIKLIIIIRIYFYVNFYVNV